MQRRPGRYNPRDVRLWEPTPQTDPDQFTDDEIRREIAYLRTTNRKYGEHTLRTLAIVRLLNVLTNRQAPKAN